MSLADLTELTELDADRAANLLLDKWLSGYFDGGTHDVGESKAVRFPKANRAYGQSDPVQPLHDFGNPEASAEIRCVVFPRHEIAEHYDTKEHRGKLVTQFVTLNFWISAKKPGKGESAYLAGQIADLLKAILTNPETRYPLAEKGVTHLTPQPVVVLPSAEYHKRLVSCGAQFQYLLRMG